MSDKKDRAYPPTRNRKPKDGPDSPITDEQVEAAKEAVDEATAGVPTSLGLDLDKIAEMVAARLTERGTSPTGAAPQASDITGVITQVMKQVNQRNAIFRTSKLPLEVDYPLNPENYDVRAAADEVAMRNGHELSVWLVAVEGVSDFWHARCVTCGAMAQAKWARRPLNDTTHYPPGEEPRTPVFGGDAISKTEAQCMSADERNRRASFMRRPRAEAS